MAGMLSSPFSPGAGDLDVLPQDLILFLASIYPNKLYLSEKLSTVLFNRCAQVLAGLGGKGVFFVPGRPHLADIHFPPPNSLGAQQPSLLIVQHQPQLVSH